MINPGKIEKNCCFGRKGLLFYLTILVSIVTLPYGTAYAKEYSIHIQFHYSTNAVPGKQVVGYNLYKDGTEVCNTGYTRNEIQDFECSFESPGGDFSFTLTALFDDETESPHSAPFSLLLVDESMVVKGLQVLSGQSPESPAAIGSQSGGSQVDMADVINMLREMP